MNEIVRYSLFALALLVAALAGVHAPHERPVEPVFAEFPVIQAGSLPRSSDGWAPQSLASASVAATPFTARLPAVSEKAARLRVDTRRATRDVAHPPHGARRAASVGWRRHVPRMDAEEPPSSVAFAP
ncbi:MAG TPA: hypothetical protein VFZ53_26395 [Polyangiaceae bacterium]